MRYRGLPWLKFVVLLAWAAGSARALSPVEPPPARSDRELLLCLERTTFDFFWLEANPVNGLIPDRTHTNSKCSIAAVGFGLSALPIGVEHAWISRAAAAQRARLTLRTFVRGSQGAASDGIIGYRGWFYHFLEMDSARRAWKCELSSIDTALLLAGALDVAQFFDRRTDPLETEIRESVDRLVRRVDWDWMRNGGETFTMGWHPESGFLRARWEGYNEAMILYLIALGAPRHPLPRSAWTAWTRTYRWQTEYGHNYVAFPHLFAHQYSHCWVDFRGQADAAMRPHGIDYFENSRRATLAQQAYAIANPLGWRGYGERLWGLTACDGPRGYAAHGAPPPDNDDGTVAPTAAGGSLPFAPEICLPTLRELHSHWGREMWTRYGFRDALNVSEGWFAEDVLGIDQGPMLLMAENYLTGSTWRRMKRSPILKRGLSTAGFLPLKTTRRPENRAAANAGVPVK